MRPSPARRAPAPRAYEYRVALNQGAGFTECQVGLVINFGPVKQLTYPQNQPAHVFVVTQGGLGSVGIKSADQSGDIITFTFDKPLCAGQTQLFLRHGVDEGADDHHRHAVRLRQSAVRADRRARAAALRRRPRLSRHVPPLSRSKIFFTGYPARRRLARQVSVGGRLLTFAQVVPFSSRSSPAGSCACRSRSIAGRRPPGGTGTRSSPSQPEAGGEHRRALARLQSGAANRPPPATPRRATGRWPRRR